MIASDSSPGSLQPAAASAASHPSSPRLYVIVRADLPAGLLLAQTGHVTRKFTRDHPELGPDDDENLVVLAVPDEAALLSRFELLRWEVPLAAITTFQEPDVGNTTTALAVLGSVTPETARALRRLLSDLLPALAPERCRNAA